MCYNWFLIDDRVLTNLRIGSETFGLVSTSLLLYIFLMKKQLKFVPLHTRYAFMSRVFLVTTSVESVLKFLFQRSVTRLVTTRWKLWFLWPLSFWLRKLHLHLDEMLKLMIMFNRVFLVLIVFKQLFLCLTQIFLSAYCVTRKKRVPSVWLITVQIWVVKHQLSRNLILWRHVLIFRNLLSLILIDFWLVNSIFN